MYYNGERLRLLRVAYRVLRYVGLKFEHVFHCKETGLS